MQGALILQYSEGSGTDMTCFERNLCGARENNCLSMSCRHANKLFLLATRPHRLQVLLVAFGNALASANPGYSNLHFTLIRSLALIRPTPAQRASMSSKRREETSAMLDPICSHCHPVLL